MMNVGGSEGARHSFFRCIFYKQVAPSELIVDTACLIGTFPNPCLPEGLFYKQKKSFEPNRSSDIFILNTPRRGSLFIETQTIKHCVPEEHPKIIRNVGGSCGTRHASGTFSINR